ncbi:DEP1 [Candida jiufengensis]|uniref:DEP1 n=1 Tax=Candida jiufengensis TaxID=497108 RepID=UPI002225403B|nr:DEP1 [Candida jiufengensis]KAI5951911.1 DEP1 [Candida jiufengensis]
MEIMEQIKTEPHNLKILDKTSDPISPPISDENIQPLSKDENSNITEEIKVEVEKDEPTQEEKDGEEEEVIDTEINDNNNVNNTISKDSPLTDIATSPPPFDLSLADSTFNLDGELKNTLENLDKDETFKTFEKFMHNEPNVKSNELNNNTEKNGELKNDLKDITENSSEENIIRMNPQRKDSYESSELSEVGDDSEAETDKMDFLEDRDSSDKPTDLQTLSELTELARLEGMDFNLNDDIDEDDHEISKDTKPSSIEGLNNSDSFTKDELSDVNDEFKSIITRKRTSTEGDEYEENNESDKKKQKLESAEQDDVKEHEEEKEEEDGNVEKEEEEDKIRKNKVIQPKVKEIAVEENDKIEEDQEEDEYEIDNLQKANGNKQITPDDEENEAEAEDEEEDEDIEEEEEEDDEDELIAKTEGHISEELNTNEDIDIKQKQDAITTEQKVAEENDVDLNEQRRLAVEGLVAIEKCFAEVRDKLYEDKLALLEKELQLCLEGSHPELSKIYYKVNGFYQDSLNLANSNLSYKLKCIDKETLATRTSIHQNYLKNIMDTKNDMITETTSMWYKINKERNQLDQIVPDFNYSAIPNNIINQEEITMGTSSTYLEAMENSTPKLRKAIKQNTIIELVQQRNNLNEQLGILNGLIQFHGFPSAISSSINDENDDESSNVKELLLRKASDEEINDDLKAMGIIRT